VNSFSYVTAAQKVVFEAGALRMLPDVVAEFGWQRLLLCTVDSLVDAGTVDRIDELLGDRLAATYTGVRPHVPLEQVEEAVAAAHTHAVDAIIGMGGGSPIGLAKAVSLELEAQRTGQPPRAEHPTQQPLVPVVAIPTTYAGSEMTPVYGVTQRDGDSTRKITVRDAKVTPKVALYDPELTLGLPQHMTATTGVNALAHCIEAVYSTTRNPLSTSAALRGVFHITRSLPDVVADGSDLDRRTDMFIGSHLAAISLATVNMSLHHGLCHVLGGTAGVPHGVANSIMLPHVVRFNLDATRDALSEVARAIGVASADELPDALHDFIGRLGLTQRLRDVGVAEEDLPELGGLALKSAAVRNNPKPITEAAQAESVYRAAY
jgi:maleylacetate reductase